MQVSGCDSGSNPPRSFKKGARNKGRRADDSIKSDDPEKDKDADSRSSVFSIPSIFSSTTTPYFTITMPSGEKVKARFRMMMVPGQFMPSDEEE